MLWIDLEWSGSIKRVNEEFKLLSSINWSQISSLLRPFFRFRLEGWWWDFRSWVPQVSDDALNFHPVYLKIRSMQVFSDDLAGAVRCHSSIKKVVLRSYLDPKSTERSRSGDMWTRLREGPQADHIDICGALGGWRQITVIRVWKNYKMSRAAPHRRLLPVISRVKLQPFSWNRRLWGLMLDKARTVWVSANPDYIVLWNFGELIEPFKHLKQLQTLWKHVAYPRNYGFWCRNQANWRWQYISAGL